MHMHTEEGWARQAVERRDSAGGSGARRVLSVAARLSDNFEVLHLPDHLPW